jgi:ferritin-like protein
MSHAGYHEPTEELSSDVRDMHRAIESLMEELEAVDWYAQRAAATKNKALKEIMLHNADEEKEHAAMLLEWIRRRDPKLDKNLRTYLYTDPKNILEVEEASEEQEEPPKPATKAAAKPAAKPAAKAPAAPKSKTVAKK